MKQAILIHGWNTKAEFTDPQEESPSNQHWFPWLTKQLMIRDIHTVSLEMPNSFYPQYDVWKKELERYELTPETILVGHSCGGGFIVRYLSEHPELKLDKVVLVAPWLGYNTGTEPFDETFFQFEIDPNLSVRTKHTVLLASTNDLPAVQKSIAKIKQDIKDIRYVELQNKGHFCEEDLGTKEFPELLQEIVR